MPQLTLSLLGSFVVHLNGTLVTQFRSDKTRALLAYLAIEAERPHLRSKLAGLLWPDYSEAAARTYLRHTLSDLRKLLGKESALSQLLVTDNERVHFYLSPLLTCDCQELTSAFAPLTAAKPAPPDPALIQRLQAALTAYTGPFLDGFALADSDRFEEWLLLTRERFHRQVLMGWQFLADHFMATQEPGQAIAMLQRILELEPTSEETHRRLMVLWAQSGNRSAAFTQFERCCQLLADELGVNPADETVALYHKIQSQAVGPPSSVPLPAFFATPQAQLVRSAPLVARAAELQHLDQFLAQVTVGQGTVVLISGDAGQGKTALANEFARRAQQTNANLLVVGGNCNAQAGVGDPYLPFCEILELLTGEVEPRLLAGAMTRDHALRLWRVAPVAVQTLVEVAPDLVDSLLPATPLLQRTALFAPQANTLTEPLHSLVQRKQTATGTPQPRQEQLFSQVAKLLQRLSQQQPLLLLIDDLQWADNGSIQLLFHLARQLGGQRILILGLLRANEVLLGRNGERHPLEPVINELKRTFGPIELDLSQRMGRAFVDALLDREPNQLDEAFRTMLYHQTEGHPLFTVELLRGMQERGDLRRDSDGQWVAGERLDWERLPARVEAVIAERIGRLAAPLQRLLQVASIEGEFFTAEVAARVLGSSESEVVWQLSELTGRRHQLVRAHGIQRLPGQRLSFFRFSHVLFQRYLYHHTSEVERAWLHEAVGNALEQLYQTQPEALSTVAVSLALHFEAAALAEKAVTYLYQAGERALRLSANLEVITHLRKALQLLMPFPETQERKQQELKIQLTLAPALAAVQGWSAPQTFTHTQRAYQLAQEVGDEAQLFAAMWGVVIHHGPRSEYRKAIDLSEKMLAVAQRMQVLEHQVVAHRLLCGFLMHTGEGYRGWHHAKQVFAHYKSTQHQFYITRYSDDPGITTHAWLCRALWLLGYPEQAFRSLHSGIDQARQAGHPFTLAYALASLNVNHYRSDLVELRCHLDELLQLTHQHKFSFMAWQAKVYHGWWLVRYGDARSALQIIQEGLADSNDIDARWAKAYFLSLLADAYRSAGQIEQGLYYLEEACQPEVKGDDQHWDAEVYRMKGEFLLASQPEATLASEACFQQALTIARRQQAKSLELRAAMSLARLWQAQGKLDDAYQLLAPVYGWFTEGFDTHDLQAAQALLDELKKRC